MHPARRRRSASLTRRTADATAGATDVALELFGLAPTPSEEPVAAVAELGRPR